jgi:hypothetical protein
MDPFQSTPRGNRSRRPGEESPEMNGKRLSMGIQRAFSASKLLQQSFGMQGTILPFAPPPVMPEDISQAYEDGLEEYGLDTVPEEDFDISEYIDLCETDELTPDTNSYGLPKVTAGGQENGGQTVETSHERPTSNLSPFLGEGTITEKDDSSSSLLSIPRQLSTEPNLAKDGWLRRTKAVLRRPSQLFEAPPASRGNGSEPHNTSKDDLLPRRTVSGPPTFTFSLFGSMGFLGSSSSLHPHPDPSPGTCSVLFKGSQTVPRILLTPASPEKPRKRRNHEPEDSNAEMNPRPAAWSAVRQPVQKKLRGESANTGLPPHPLFVGKYATTPFPGNTEGLSYNLLTWHSTMRNLYAKINDPCLMALHPMFPYRPTKPVHVPLVSASFWNTGMEPHKELWFIGPGDVETLSYNEVDTFSERREIPADKKKRTNRFKQIMSNAEARRMKMRDPAQSGDGRWCFIVIRGHRGQGNQDHKGVGRFTSKTKFQDEEVEEVAPYIVIAFPKSAVTQSTECLHMLYPDSGEPAKESEAPPAPEPQMQPRIGRSISTPILNKAFRKPSISNFPFQFRRSNANLTDDAQAQQTFPPLPFQQATEKKGVPWTLRRTILWFEKGGNLPLVEGYRTDATLWKPFLDAVSKGEGKIMLFCETNQ